MFFRLHKCDSKDFIAVLSVLSGVSYSKISQARQLDIDEQLAPHIAWAREKVNWKKVKIPKEIYFGMKTMEVPTDLEVESFGKKITLDAKVNELLGQGEKGKLVDLAELIPYAFSVYFCDKYYGKAFDQTMVTLFLPVVNGLPIKRVYPIGAFFLKKYSASESSTQKGWRPRWILTRLLLAFRLWRSTVNLQRLTRSRKVTS